MNVNIDIIVRVLIPILGAIITYILVPFLKSKTSKEQREAIYFWVKIAVNAAEQIYAEKGQGKLKKEYVLEFLINQGISVTIQELDMMIEAAVKELNMVQQELSKK